MQKKIIALAIAAAISAPAFADTSNVTVYGVMDVSYDSIRTGTSTLPVATPAQGITSNRVSSNTSRLGLKGSEDLGDGLSAIWQIESLVSPGAVSSTGTGIGGRNTFLGLSSAAAGTVVMGRHDTPYKISTRAYDLFGDGIADNRSIMGGSPTANSTAAATASAAASFDGRQDQVVAYISPKLGGVATLAVGYVNLSPLDNVATQAKNSAVSVAGMFDIGSGFGAALAYEAHDFGAVGATAATKEKATKIGASYTMDAINVNFAYEKTSDNLGTAGADLYGHNAYYLSGKYNVTASDAIKLAYTKAGTLNASGVAATSANTDAKQFTLGYDHTLTKRTYVYALYTKLTNGSAAGYTLGAGTSAVGGITTSAGTGASPSAFAFGMRHTF